MSSHVFILIGAHELAFGLKNEKVKQIQCLVP